jgi:hypothetical protein
VPVAAEHVLRVHQVLEHVAEDDAVQGAGLDRRSLGLYVEDEHLVESLARDPCGVRVQFHAGDVAALVLPLQLVTEPAAGAADLEDAAGARRHRPEQALVEAVMVVVRLRLREHDAADPSRSCP